MIKYNIQKDIYYTACFIFVVYVFDLKATERSVHCGVARAFRILLYELQCLNFQNRLVLLQKVQFQFKSEITHPNKIEFLLYCAHPNTPGCRTVFNQIRYEKRHFDL